MTTEDVTEQKNITIPPSEPPKDVIKQTTEPPKTDQTPQPELPKDKERIDSVPFKAYDKERRKRQQMFSENAQLRQRLDTLEKQITVNNDGAAIPPDTETNKEMAKMKNRFVKLSIVNITDKHSDAMDMFDIFDSDSSGNQALYNEFLESDDPGRYAYDYGKKKMQVEKYGSSPEEIIQNVRREVKEEVKQEVVKDVFEKLKTQESQPKNLSGLRSVGSDIQNPDTGPAPLKSFFGK